MKPLRNYLIPWVLLMALALAYVGCGNAPAKKGNTQTAGEMSSGFVYLDESIPDARYDIRYYGQHNFVGTRIDGYLAPRAIITAKAAAALENVQQELKGQGMGLKVFDTYRPTQAVDHFVRWVRDPGDIKMKQEFYPNIDKSQLFKQGFISYRSGHSRGSAVDLTLVRLDTGEELDMGGAFDLLDPISGHDSPLITEQQQSNRRLLRGVMERNGFKAISKEWWHYLLVNEPFPKKYFDFPVQ